VELVIECISLLLPAGIPLIRRRLRVISSKSVEAVCLQFVESENWPGSRFRAAGKTSSNRIFQGAPIGFVPFLYRFSRVGTTAPHPTLDSEC
jgi:hypothetical protein